MELTALEYMIGGEEQDGRYIPPLGCNDCPFLEHGDFLTCKLLGVYIDVPTDPKCTWYNWRLKAAQEIISLIKMIRNLQKIIRNQQT